MCIGTIPGKHRLKEGASKWFQLEREPRTFQTSEVLAYGLPLPITKSKIVTYICIIHLGYY
jgi:hypothetical protein